MAFACTVSGMNSFSKILRQYCLSLVNTRTSPCSLASRMHLSFIPVEKVMLSSSLSVIRRACSVFGRNSSLISPAQYARSLVNTRTSACLSSSRWLLSLMAPNFQINSEPLALSWPKTVLMLSRPSRTCSRKQARPMQPLFSKKDISPNTHFATLRAKSMVPARSRPLTGCQNDRMHTTRPKPFQAGKKRFCRRNASVFTAPTLRFPILSL